MLQHAAPDPLDPRLSVIQDSGVPLVEPHADRGRAVTEEACTSAV
jgi:hypothetical protein